MAAVKSNNYAVLKFKYGFCATTAGTPIINPHWGVFQVDNFYLTYDKSIEFSSNIDEGMWLLVYGKIVSLNCSSIAHNDLTNHLFKHLSSSIEEFYDELDYCCGRFVIIYSINGKTHALHDAGGMKAIYYTASEFIAIASHAGILAQLCNKQFSSAVQEDIVHSKSRTYNVAFTPGFVTVYDDVFSLCPNTEICLEDASVHRYFPRGPIPDMSLEESVSKAAKLMKDLFNKWHRLYPIAISITAGLDSRVTTAAACEKADEVLFFTYVRKGIKNDISDYNIAMEMLERYGLSSMLLNFEYPYRANIHNIQKFIQFKSVIKENVEQEHFFSLAFAYYNEFPREYLHLRSNLGEVARARCYQPVFELARNEKPLARAFAAMHNIWNRRKKITRFSLEKFNQYIDETNLAFSYFNYHIFDLFYWEHYMGRWQPCALAESDVAFDSTSLYNCRAVLQSCLSAPFEDRVSAKIQLDIITKLWPDLLATPINPWKKKAKMLNRFVEPLLSISNVGSSYTFTVDIDRSDCNFAFYLYEDDEIILRQGYSADNFFRVDLDQPGHYRVKCFIVRAKQPDKRKAQGGENKVSVWFHPVSIY